MNARRAWGLVICGATALTVALELYLVADQASGGALRVRLERWRARWWAPLARRREIDELVARDAGHVIWEAMEALEHE